MFEPCALGMRKYYDIIHLPWIFDPTTYYIKCSVPRPPKNEEFFMIPHVFTSHTPSCKIYLLNLPHCHGTLNGILCSPRPLLDEWHPLGTSTIYIQGDQQAESHIVMPNIQGFGFWNVLFPQIHLTSLLNIFLIDFLKKLRPRVALYRLVVIDSGTPDWYKLREASMISSH